MTDHFHAMLGQKNKTTDHFHTMLGQKNKMTDYFHAMLGQKMTDLCGSPVSDNTPDLVDNALKD